MARLTLRDRLANLLHGWASALSPELASVARADAPAEATVDGPPPHWQAAARLLPNAQWLETVRQYAPQLLDGGDGVVDWMADDTHGDLTPATDARTVAEVPPPRPVPSAIRAVTPVAIGRPLRLVDVRTSVSPAVPVRGVTSEPRRAASLRVVAADSRPDTVLRRPERAVHQTAGLATKRDGLQPRALNIREIREYARIDRPETRDISEASNVEPTLTNVETGSFSSRRRSSSPLLHQREPRTATSVSRLKQALSKLNPLRRPSVSGTVTVRADAINPPSYSARAELERTPAPMPRQYLADAPVLATYASQPRPASERPAVGRRDFPASSIRVASHRFPALLDDEREPVMPDMHALQRRQRLDAEQEGRAWNG